MISFWEEKPDFWGNRTDGNAIYEAQGKELGDHLTALARKLKAKTILDVGGYKGRMRGFLPKGLTYFNYDIINGMDITKPWDQKGEPRMKYDIIFTSLVLIAFPPEEMQKIMWEIRGHATKAIVLFEEDWSDRISFEDGSKMNNDYGGKWQYHWLRALKAHDNNVQVQRSKVSPNWAIYTQIL